MTTSPQTKGGRDASPKSVTASNTELPDKETDMHNSTDSTPAVSLDVLSHVPATVTELVIAAELQGIAASELLRALVAAGAYNVATTDDAE